MSESDTGGEVIRVGSCDFFPEIRSGIINQFSAPDMYTATGISRYREPAITAHKESLAREADDIRAASAGMFVLVVAFAITYAFA